MTFDELRIGNIVYGINRRNEVHFPVTLPLKVLQIELFNAEVLPLDKNPATEKEWFKISNSDLSPVPLSVAWLEKFGFVGKDHWYYKTPFVLGFITNDSNFQIEITTHGAEQSRIIELKYVHQLQNLYYAITGTDLQLT